MPDHGTIIWAGIAGIIVLMLGVIGYLLKTGFDGIREELKSLWDKLDNHQTMTEKNAQEIAKIQARCEERHR